MYAYNGDVYCDECGAKIAQTGRNFAAAVRAREVPAWLGHLGDPPTYIEHDEVGTPQYCEGCGELLLLAIYGSATPPRHQKAWWLLVGPMLL